MNKNLTEISSNVNSKTVSRTTDFPKLNLKKDEDKDKQKEFNKEIRKKLEILDGMPKNFSIKTEN